MKSIISIVLITAILFSFSVGFYSPVYAETKDVSITAEDLLGIISYDGTKNVKGSYIGMLIYSINVKPTAKDYNGIILGPEIRKDDLIYEIEGKEFKSMDEFLNTWNECKKRDSFKIKVLRGEKEKTATIKKDDFQNFEFIAMPASLGIVIKKVDVGSPANKAGIQNQDQIIKMNQKPIKDQKSLDKMVEKCQPGDTLNFEFIREDERINTEIILENPKIKITEIAIQNTQAVEREEIPLISIKATGNLDIDSSFIWTKIDTDTSKQISLKKQNSTLGMKVQNSYDEETGEYTSTLWADKIKKEADGEYYCQIMDRFKVSVNSEEFSISVK